MIHRLALNLGHAVINMKSNFRFSPDSLLLLFCCCRCSCVSSDENGQNHDFAVFCYNYALSEYLQALGGQSLSPPKVDMKSKTQTRAQQIEYELCTSWRRTKQALTRLHKS